MIIPLRWHIAGLGCIGAILFGEFVTKGLVKQHRLYSAMLGDAPVWRNYLSRLGS